MAQGNAELMKHLQVIYKRRYLFVGVALLVMSGFILNSYRLPKHYQADSTVFIETNVINDLFKGLAVTPDMDDRIRVLKYALLSRDILNKALTNLHVEAKSETKLQELIASLQKRTDIKVNGKDLFTVSFVDTNPAFARDFINTLISTYLQESRSGKQEETVAANRFLEEQLQQTKTKLEQAEDAIIDFRKKAGVLPASDEQAVLQAITDYRRELENIDLNENALKAKKAELQAQLKNVQAAVAVGGTAHKNQRIVDLENQLQKLLLTYTEDYPEVVRTKRELAEVRAAAPASAAATDTNGTPVENPAYQELQQKVYDVNAEISALEGRAQTVHSFLQQRETQLKRVPENSKQLALLIQDRDSLKKVHEELLARLSQSEVSKQMGVWAQGATFRVVDPALLPTIPVAPDMVRMILMAIVIGLGSGIGVVLLADNFDTRVKDLGQIRDIGVPVLAVVPGIVDEHQIHQRKLRDMLIYALSAVYLAGVLALLVYEATKH